MHISMLFAKGNVFSQDNELVDSNTSQNAFQFGDIFSEKIMNTNEIPANIFSTLSLLGTKNATEIAGTLPFSDYKTSCLSQNGSLASHMMINTQDDSLTTIENTNVIDRSEGLELNANLEIEQEKLTSTLIELAQKSDELSLEISEVLEQLLEEPENEQYQGELLQLLEPLIKLIRFSDRLRIPMQPIKMTNPKLQVLWDNISSAYERRETLSTMGKYVNESTVDQRTLSQWLNNILKDQTKIAQGEISHVHSEQIGKFNVSAPMTKTEQLVIHMHQYKHGASITVEQQLLDKFEQAIRTSQFLRTNHGTNQLIIHLKPDNLGEMTVRLMEVNGELTAKIIVTSEVTKKALQSNIHQLKTMFSPHQVVIEKQDELIIQQPENEGEQMDEQTEGQEHLFEKENDQSEQNASEETSSFAEILTEKV